MTVIRRWYTCIGMPGTRKTNFIWAWQTERRPSTVFGGARDRSCSATTALTVSRPPAAVMDVLPLMFLLFGIALADISHLDRLLNRLDGSTQPPPAELSTPGPLHRVRHSHLLHELKEDYEDEEEEDEEESQADHVQRSPYSTSVSHLNIMLNYQLKNVLKHYYKKKFGIYFDILQYIFFLIYIFPLRFFSINIFLNI